MCGRLNITDNEGIRLLMELVGMPSWPSIIERYNVSPTQTIDVLIPVEQLNNTGVDILGRHQTMQWGIIPSWAKPGQFNRPLINARAETVWEKPSFKRLIKQRRALVPVTGFYEWLRIDNAKTPYYLYPAAGSAMFLGAIYQYNSENSAQVSLITTAANDSMSEIHHRMPVVIPTTNAAAWLNETDETKLNELMQPSPNDTLAFHRISSYVNSSKNDGPECIEAA